MYYIMLLDYFDIYRLSDIRKKRVKENIFFLDDIYGL